MTADEPIDMGFLSLPTDMQAEAEQVAAVKQGGPVTDPLADLTAIVRERHETGTYGDCLRVAADVWARMRAASAPARPSWLPDLGSLPSLPVVVDDDAPPGRWKLVQRTYDGDPPNLRRSETVIREGTVT